MWQKLHFGSSGNDSASFTLGVSVLNVRKTDKKKHVLPFLSASSHLVLKVLSHYAFQMYTAVCVCVCVCVLSNLFKGKHSH